ncbi:hypothetical protein KIL84_019615, partial [Mauremys mutica]
MEIEDCEPIEWEPHLPTRSSASPQVLTKGTLSCCPYWESLNYGMEWNMGLDIRTFLNFQGTKGTSDLEGLSDWLEVEELHKQIQLVLESSPQINPTPIEIYLHLKKYPSLMGRALEENAIELLHWKIPHKELSHLSTPETCTLSIIVGENSPLYQYLQDLGHTDFEICSAVSQKTEQCTAAEGQQEQDTCSTQK